MRFEGSECSLGGVTREWRGWIAVFFYLYFECYRALFMNTYIIRIISCLKVFEPLSIRDYLTVWRSRW